MQFMAAMGRALRFSGLPGRRSCSPRLMVTAAKRDATSLETLVKPKNIKRANQLLKLPGVGPKNATRLEAANLRSVQDLKDLYYTMRGDIDKVAVYLKEEVGIKQVNHRKSICEYIEGLLIRHLGCTLSVEGNISAGKSTFLQILNDKDVSLELQEALEVIPEPVEKWQNAGAKGEINLLDEFYKDPNRYAYTFQNYVFVTRLLQGRQGSGDKNKLRLLERSVFSDRMVFVKAVHMLGMMNNIELGVYDSWFNPLLELHPELVPDGFIYLRASPDTCHRRRILRGRNEESDVTVEYLEHLHNYHESWLYDGARNLFVPPNFAKSKEVLLSDGQVLQETKSTLFPANAARTLSTPNNTLRVHDASNDAAAFNLPPIPLEIRGHVLMLDGENNDTLPRQLHAVPALLIDCDNDIDLQHDLDAKRMLAEKVKTFSQWMAEYRRSQHNARLNAPAADAASSSSSSYSNIVLPHNIVQQRTPALVSAHA